MVRPRTTATDRSDRIKSKGVHLPSVDNVMSEADDRGECHDLDISAVIVSWNTVDLLQQCLESLRDHPAAGRRHEVIVVDNASSDGSAELVRDQWPDVQLIINPVNEGYQKANNRGMAAARGRYLLLINADAMLTPGCLDTLVARLEADEGNGIVGPRLVYGDGSWQRWTAGSDPSLFGAVAFFLFGERFSKRLARRSLWLASDVDEPFACDWVSSACLLMRQAVLADTGLMDERFFAYMDDVDLCHKARQAGWSVWYEPTAQAVHLMGQSSRRQTGAASPNALRSFNRYFALRHGPRQALVLRSVEAIGFALRSLAHRALLARRRGVEHHRQQARDHARNVRVALEPAVPPGPTA